MPSWLVLPVMWLTAWCSKPRKPTTLTMPATHESATAPIQTQVGRRIPIGGAPQGPPKPPLNCSSLKVLLAGSNTAPQNCVPPSQTRIASRAGLMPLSSGRWKALM